MLSVVIPALNAAHVLPACLEALGAVPGNLIREIIVADGGSSDGTDEIAGEAGAHVVSCSKGRGVQLAAGAREARGEWLLFLHADTVLEPGWAEEAAAFMDRTRVNDGRAAAFRFALNDDVPAARRMERLVAWRGRALGLPYGDQGLLISRAFYDALGGYKPMPLMEDVDLVRRIGKNRLAILNARAVTDAARYRQGGYWLRPLRNIALVSLYFLGVPPRLLARLYG